MLPLHVHVCKKNPNQDNTQNKLGKLSAGLGSAADGLGGGHPHAHTHAVDDRNPA